MAEKCLSNLELFGPPKDGTYYTFEECQPVIEAEIRKRRKKWMLDKIAYMDFDDVVQIIQLHIFVKWHLWDQNRPILLWLNRTTSHQIFNLLRNTYLSKSCVCTSCPLNLGGGVCREYGNTRSHQCQTYNMWSSSKKFDKEQVNFPHSIHELEENAQEKLICQNSLNPIYDYDKFHELMLTVLSPPQQQIYTWLYIENKSEEEVSKLMGYEKNVQSKNPKSRGARSPGYRTLIKFKAIFVKHAKKLIETNDF